MGEDRRGEGGSGGKRRRKGVRGKVWTQQRVEGVNKS